MFSNMMNGSRNANVNINSNSNIKNQKNNTNIRRSISRNSNKVNTSTNGSYKQQYQHQRYSMTNKGSHSKVVPSATPTPTLTPQRSIQQQRVNNYKIHVDDGTRTVVSPANTNMKINTNTNMNTLSRSATGTSTDTRIGTITAKESSIPTIKSRTKIPPQIPSMNGDEDATTTTTTTAMDTSKYHSGKSNFSCKKHNQHDQWLQNQKRFKGCNYNTKGQGCIKDTMKTTTTAAAATTTTTTITKKKDTNQYKKPPHINNDHNQASTSTNDEFIGHNIVDNASSHLSSPSSTDNLVATDAASQALLKRVSINTRWNDIHEELLGFKQKHGHVKVPHLFSENPKLGKWVGKLRYQYREYKKTNGQKGDPEQLKRLERIGLFDDILIRKHENKKTHCVNDEVFPPMKASSMSPTFSSNSQNVVTEERPLSTGMKGRKNGASGGANTQAHLDFLGSELIDKQVVWV